MCCACASWLCLDGCRQAIEVAGQTGRFTTPVQFSTHELSGTADGVMATNAKLRSPAQCNDTLYSFLQSHPELSTLLQHINKAGKGVGSCVTCMGRKVSLL